MSPASSKQEQQKVKKRRIEISYVVSPAPTSWIHYPMTNNKVINSPNIWERCQIVRWKSNHAMPEQNLLVLYETDWYMFGLGRDQPGDYYGLRG